MFLLLQTALAYATETHESDKKNCLSKHIRSALKINKSRSKKYAMLTNNESISLSRQLILYETLALAPSLIMDKLALKYQKNKIPVFCKDLIKMNGIGPFKPFGLRPLYSFSQSRKLNIKVLKNNILRNLNKKNYQTLILLLKSELLKIDSSKNYLCLTRHFLESITRTLILLKEYKKQAAAINFKSPEKLIVFYLKSQTWFLGALMKLDQQAAKFQEQGIALFCQDLPEIPIPKL
jgi:hypothetical protein